jgi:hypothetical protein
MGHRQRTLADSPNVAAETQRTSAVSSALIGDGMRHADNGVQWDKGAGETLHFHLPHDCTNSTTTILIVEAVRASIAYPHSYV